MGNACCPRKHNLKNSPYLSVYEKKPINEEVPQKQVDPIKPSKPPVIQQRRLLTELHTKADDNFEKIFTLGRMLGKGRYGTAFLCVEKQTGKEYACKLIEKSKLIGNEEVEGLRMEIQIMHHVAGNPHVASIQGAYEDDKAVYIVMEFCSGDELFDRIKQHGHYAEKDAAEIISSIVTVVRSLHSIGVMHRDLKPEHFLFVNQKEDSALKLIDFGFSTFFRPDEKFRQTCGTASYTAPEVLQKDYGPGADIWSVGVILYILLSGYNPFWAERKEDMHQNVLHGGDLDFSSNPWPTISESAKDLVRRMLDRDPTTRITTAEILCHHWFQVNRVTHKHMGPHGVPVMYMESKEHAASEELQAPLMCINGASDLLQDADVNGCAYPTAKAFFLGMHT